MKNKCNNYSHFSDEERIIAYRMRAKGESLRKICRALGRRETAAGSLSREFKRNEPKSPILKRDMDSYDRARYANEKAKERSKIPRKNHKLETDPELKKFVERQLEAEEASPRDICWRVKRELSGKSISHTAIYDHTKRNRGLIQKLRRKGKPNKQRVTKRKKPTDKSVKRRNISERSLLVEERREFGHYEADTIHSCKNGSGYAILSVRERKSRKRWFFIVRDLQAETTLALLLGFFSRLPRHMRRTLTVDNGPENKLLHELEKRFCGFMVYNCDPYCSWQRGSIENANGEFRWYFPKGTDFKEVSLAEIWEVQDKLNRRCMDCLGGKTAEEVFQQALKNPPRIHLAPAEVLLSQDALFEAAGLRFEQNSNLYLPSQAQWG
jgi:IS30 family transposase